MASIELSPEEIAILRSALDSAEYWEHKDALPHNSGYILDPEDYEIEGLKESEAWAEVLAIRALDTRLMELEKPTENQICTCSARGDTSVCMCTTPTEEGVCFDCSIGTHTFHWARRNR